MTLDQIIKFHDELVVEAETHFPKPLKRAEIKDVNPKLSLVKNKKTKIFTVDDYLGCNLESFFKNIIVKADFRE